MSERLQRYFAALLGCALASTWAAAGLGPTLAGLIASAVAYVAVAFSQRRSPLPSGHGRAAERGRVTRARPTPRAPAQAGPRRAGPAARRARPPADEWSSHVAEPAVEPEERPAARYGW